MALMRGSANAMSEVISFRLSKENPREALAYEILKGWHEKGHSIRHTITEALLKLGEPCPDLVPHRFGRLRHRARPSWLAGLGRGLPDSHVLPLGL